MTIREVTKNMHDLDRIDGTKIIHVANLVKSIEDL